MKKLKHSKVIVSSVLCAGLLVSSSQVSATQLFPSSTIEKNTSHINSVHNRSMWKVMSQNFKLNDATNGDFAQRPEVQKQIAILQKNANNLYKLLKDAAPYISYVYNETEKRQLPAELALLPVVESNFNPHAKSHAGALGLWQIMPGTASGLGLTKNDNYDGRKDIVASTNAALKYLNQLSQSFKNDWFIALGAYNWGPGNIQKAIKKNNQKNYWVLKMPKETKDYVPKLLALAAIVQDPERYNIKLPPLDTTLALVSIQVNEKVDLKKVAESAGIDVETMKSLNPGYHNMATVKGAPNTLLVPAEKARDVLKAVNQPQDAVILAANEEIPANTRSMYTPADESIDGNNNRHLIKAIFKEGRWAIRAFADTSINQI